MSEFMEVIRQCNRMCANYAHCRDGCPLYDSITDAATLSCGEFLKAEPEKFEKIVMEWAAKHPEKTMMDVFFEKFPNAERNNQGTPYVCPFRLGWSTEETCLHTCLECWSRPAPDYI